ncbi:MAG: putative quinol monooxygenase [Phycisphaerales bacterium]
MSQLTIVATIRSRPEKVNLVRAELEKLVPITRDEAGCLQYDLHQDRDDPARFLFYENWESRELWLAHMNAPHLQSFQRATDGALIELTIYEMDRIGS